MSTVVLDVYTKAYPSITNRIKASVARQSAPLAIVASIIDTTVGHPERTWSFPGLPRDNYAFSLDEIDSGGFPINNLALFSVVPGTVDGMLVRDDEQIQVDNTVGLAAGAVSFVFDGTGGKPNYIGWNITISEMYARGIMQKGDIDFTWNKLTGEFAFIQPGDQFQSGQWYNVHFDPIVNTVGNSYPTLRDFGIELITTDTTLTDVQFGKKIIVEPASNLITLTLPAIASIVEGRPMMLEASESATMFCIKVVKVDGTIEWLRGNIYMLPGERLSIYVYSRSGTPEWRVCDVDGNFRNVGQIVSEDNIQADVFNKQLFDGSIVDADQFARIYNEFVLNLPITQVCNFDDWTTGDNKYLYSLANSTNPTYLNKFRFPDRRGLFERNNSVGKAGDHQAQDTLFTYKYTTGTGSGQGAITTGLGYQGGPPAAAQFRYDNLTVGTETRPENYLINKYVLL